MNVQKARHKANYHAVQVTEDNATEVMHWCDGYPSTTPGAVIAFKVWTGTTMIAKLGDWIVQDDQDQFRSIAQAEFARHYETI